MITETMHIYTACKLTLFYLNRHPNSLYMSKSIKKDEDDDEVFGKKSSDTEPVSVAEKQSYFDSKILEEKRGTNVRSQSSVTKIAENVISRFENPHNECRSDSSMTEGYKEPSVNVQERRDTFKRMAKESASFSTSSQYDTSEIKSGGVAEMKAIFTEKINKDNSEDRNIVPFIIKKHCADGSWKFDEELITAIGLEPETVIKEKPDNLDMETWMTVMVHNSLTTRLQDDINVSCLSDKKAQQFIYNRIRDSQVHSTRPESEMLNVQIIICDAINKALLLQRETMTFMTIINFEEMEEVRHDQIWNLHKMEVFFLLDRSESMNGIKIESLKECLEICLKALPTNCYFQIYGFGSNFDKVFKGVSSQKYDDAFLEEANIYGKRIQADFGRTDIMKPLMDVYKQRLKTDYSRVVFVITDGDVKNLKDVLKLVEQNKETTRIFSIGIGDKATKRLIRGIAEASEGRYIFVKDSINLTANLNQLINEATRMTRNLA